MYLSSLAQSSVWNAEIALLDLEILEKQLALHSLYFARKRKELKLAPFLKAPNFSNSNFGQNL